MVNVLVLCATRKIKVYISSAIAYYTLGAIIFCGEKCSIIRAYHLTKWGEFVRNREHIFRQTDRLIICWYTQMLKLTRGSWINVAFWYRVQSHFACDCIWNWMIVSTQKCIDKYWTQKSLVKVFLIHSVYRDCCIFSRQSAAYEGIVHNCTVHRATKGQNSKTRDTN